MFNISIENEWNRSLELTHNERKWKVTKVTGLNPPAAVISTSTVAGMDGSRFNSSRLDDRNIVITMVFEGDVETNRTIINNMVLPKRYIKVLYKTKTKNVYIEGYVESLEYDVFDAKVAAQISIICPDPYWKDREYNVVSISQVIDLFEFPISLPVGGTAISEIMDAPTVEVLNGGNIESGALIEIETKGYVLNPKVMDLSTGQNVEMAMELSGGDRLVISTSRGNKHIMLDRDCVTTNVINKKTAESEWITLTPGANRFTYSAEAGARDMVVRISHRNLYGGI